MIVMDYNPLTPMRADNVNGHLLFGTTGHDVVTTVCNGKVLMKDREVLVCDVDKVMADCRQSAQELADDINGGNKYERYYDMYAFRAADGLGPSGEKRQDTVFGYIAHTQQIRRMI